MVEAADQLAAPRRPLRLEFWVEAETFDWRDALIYMVMTDRFRDGDPRNNPAPTPGADPRGDFQGGDLEGAAPAIADGTLDELGVRAHLADAVSDQPDGRLSSRPTASTRSPGITATGRSRRARSIRASAATRRSHALVDGGARARHPRPAGLRRQPRARGARVLRGAPRVVPHRLRVRHRRLRLDRATRSTACSPTTCPTSTGTDARGRRSSSSPTPCGGSTTFDLDGLRVDAVKHVEEVAARNLAASVRESFEAAAREYFLMGETAMGWSDCDDSVQRRELRHHLAATSARSGSTGSSTSCSITASRTARSPTATRACSTPTTGRSTSLDNIRPAPIMTPYIGSHDTARFVTSRAIAVRTRRTTRRARATSGANMAVAPDDAEPYARHARRWPGCSTVPGAPLLYYGDEYGEVGRRRSEQPPHVAQRPLSADETATLASCASSGNGAASDCGAAARQPISRCSASRGRSWCSRVRRAPTGAGRAFALGGGPVLQVRLPVAIPPGTILKDRLGGPQPHGNGPVGPSRSPARRRHLRALEKNSLRSTHGLHSHQRPSLT